MKFIQLFLLLALVVYMACGSPVPIRRDHHRVLINRPTKEDIFNSRVRRSDQPGVKGRPVLKPLPALATSVRKGEYVCGNKICKLQPGQIPNECKGCQYPIH